MHINSVTVSGRLGRDPEDRTTQATRIASASFCVPNRKKSPSGEWIDDPCWLTLKCFQFATGRPLAEWFMECKKGELLVVTGRLVEETWEKDGQRHSRMCLYVAEFIRCQRNSGDSQPAPVSDEEIPY